MDKKENNLLIKKSNKIYNMAVKKHGMSSGAVLLDDQQTQYFRFNEIIKFIDVNNTDKTVLDIGCGNAELYKFLNFSGFRGKYTGYDINNKLVMQAKKKYKNIDVQKKDILTQKIAEKFDYVIMSGLFNANVNQSIDWIHTFISTMFSLCNKVLIFNAISDYVNYKDKKMVYLSPEDILSYCIKNLSARVTLVHHNLRYNFTVVVYKDNSWKSIN